MFTIGIDLGGTNVKGALVDEQGGVQEEYSCPTRAERGESDIADSIAQVILTLSSRVERHEISGVGVGCPGTVDDQNGIVRFAGNLPWKNYPLRQELMQRTGFCVHLGNDANTAALAEALVGCGKDAQSIVVVTLGTGVGAGVVLGGKLLTGYTGAASELGHMVIHEGGAKCTCGRRGCLEAYASATALIRQTKAAMLADPDSLLHQIVQQQGYVDGRTAFLAKECGDRTAGIVVEQYIEHLACGLTNIVNIFFPEIVALSGGVANQGETLLAPLRKRVREMSFGADYAAAHTRIECCTLGYRAGVIGAAMLAKK